MTTILDSVTHFIPMKVALMYNASGFSGFSHRIGILYRKNDAKVSIHEFKNVSQKYFLENMMEINY